MLNRFVIALFIIMIPAYCQSYSLVYSSNHLISIHSLDVDGNIYNVDFLYTTPDNAIYPEKLLLWKNQTDAINAANSILNILNEEEIDFVLRSSTGRHFVVTYEYVWPNSKSVYVNKQDIWYIWMNEYVHHSAAQTITSWTTVAPVPIPSSLWLFALGLIGVYRLRRIQKDHS